MSQFTAQWVEQQNAKKQRKLPKAKEPDIYDVVRDFREKNPELDSPLDVVISNFDRQKPKLAISLTGQVRGGKNAIQITRDGHRYPNPKWARWRDRMVASVKSQLPEHFQTITTAANVRLTYWAGDMRRRDMPAIIDAIWHVLEKSGVVKDDTLLWAIESSRLYSKENPGALIEFL